MRDWVPGTISTSLMRPPAMAGPMERHWRAAAMRGWAVRGAGGREQGGQGREQNGQREMAGVDADAIQESSTSRHDESLRYVRQDEGAGPGLEAPTDDTILSRWSFSGKMPAAGGVATALVARLHRVVCSRVDQSLATIP